MAWYLKPWRGDKHEASPGHEQGGLQPRHANCHIYTASSCDNHIGAQLLLRNTFLIVFTAELINGTAMQIPVRLTVCHLQYLTLLSESVAECGDAVWRVDVARFIVVIRFWFRCGCDKLPCVTYIHSHVPSRPGRRAALYSAYNLTSTGPRVDWTTGFDHP